MFDPGDVSKELCERAERYRRISVGVACDDVREALLALANKLERSALLATVDPS